MHWQPSLPKKSETDGKVVKKQSIDKLLGRNPKLTLDTPLKSVYNIRKDMKEVQHLYDTFVKVKNGKDFAAGDNLYSLNVANETVTNIFSSIGLDLPILAGGALRDLFYNQRPKDYDYFINCRDKDHAYEVMDEICLALGNYTEGGEKENYETEGGDFEGVWGVFNKIYYNLPLQFIVGVWPESERFYDRFDLSVCQLEMDIATGNITVSDAFLDTVRTNSIKVLRDSKYSRARHNRLHNKLYPQHTDYARYL